MSGVVLRASAHCLAGCGWTAAGTPADVDREAAAHFRDGGPPGARHPGHSVAITAEPVDPVPPSARQRAVHDVTVDRAPGGWRWSCHCGDYGPVVNVREAASVAGRGHVVAMRR